MCGFVGYCSVKDHHRLKEDLPGAAATLSHRGPDDAGVYCDDDAGVGLAHRRLSIIDLSTAGHQPMEDEVGRVWIVYNGEVYNFRSIRETLAGLGHRFRGGSDTEVILKAYRQWGIDCLHRFVGMFALALWDAGKKILFLARDRLGVKPLYYHIDGERFLFASELKALAAFKSVDFQIDPEALPLFLHYQYIPAPRTVYRNTYKLLPGHLLIFKENACEAHCWWQIPDVDDPRETPPDTEGEAIERLDALLSQAVSDRLTSDVPLGGLLSGGIDSSTVVSIMQKIKASPVETFSIGFQEGEYNEAPWASKIAEYLGTNHTELYVTPKEALEVVPRLPDIYDEPFADSSAIPTTLVCQLARSRLTVALSGDGGDEQFAGYVRYGATEAMARSFGRLPAPIRRAAGKVLGALPASWIARGYHPIRGHLPQRFIVVNFEDKWRKLVRQLDRTSLSDLYRMTICLWSEDEIAQLTGQKLPQSHYESLFKKTAGWPALDRLMRVDQGTYLSDAMLTKVDRASMSVSLEVRVPLLDHRVVEYTSALPAALKYRNGSGKILLRKLLARYLPPAMFERPKMGFGVPVDRWLRGALKPLLTDYLSSERLQREGVFDAGNIERKVQEHLTGRANHEYRLWTLLMWEMWRERWM